MKTKWERYKELELISDAMWESGLRHVEFPTSNLKSWLKRFCRVLMDIFANDPEPRIWEKYDRDGHPYWYVYDPVTGASGSFSSRAEVLSWLEARYRLRGKI